MRINVAVLQQMNKWYYEYDTDKGEGSLSRQEDTNTVNCDLPYEVLIVRSIMLFLFSFQIANILYKIIFINIVTYLFKNWNKWVYWLFLKWRWKWRRNGTIITYLEAYQVLKNYKL